MRFVRFELTFEGEQQGVGLFQGLEDALPYDAFYLMDTYFLTMVNPNIDDKTCDPVSCWFTETGLKRYMSDIQILADFLVEAGWGLCVAVIEEKAENAIYIDDDQAIFTREFLGNCYDLVNIAQLEDVKTLLPDDI